MATISRRGICLSQKPLHFFRLPRNGVHRGYRAFSTRPQTFTHTSLRWRSHAPILQVARPSIAPIISSSISARFQSTAPLVESRLASTQPSAAAFGDPTSHAQAPTFSTSLDQLDFPTSSAGIMQVEPHIGYLKELGLDYGWGPTAVMETFYETVHVLAGTPWWGSIVIACVIYRVVILAGPQLVASDMMARSQTLLPLMKPLNEKMAEAMTTGDQRTMLTARAELTVMRRASGVKMWKTLVAPVIQMFMGYGTFCLLRAMAQLPVPGLDVEGFLWVKDLTIPDPFYILPVTMSAAMWFLVRSGGETGAGTASFDSMPTLKHIMLYGFPLMTLVFMSWHPACLQLSFAVTSILGHLQAKLLQRSSVRKALGLFPLPQHANPQTQGGSTAAKKTVVKRITQFPAQEQGVMSQYQAPTTASIFKNLPPGDTRVTTSTPTPPQNGLLGSFRGMLSRTVGKTFRNIVKEGLAMAGKVEESPEKKVQKRRASDYEKRRRREIAEDAEYRKEYRRQRRRD